eukprot:IDg6639t1
MKLCSLHHLLPNLTRLIPCGACHCTPYHSRYISAINLSPSILLEGEMIQAELSQAHSYKQPTVLRKRGQRSDHPVKQTPNSVILKMCDLKSNLRLQLKLIGKPVVIIAQSTGRT